MALTSAQQAIDLVSRASRILLATPEHPNPDALSGAVVLSLLLTKLKKTHDVVIPGLDKNALPAYLPSIEARPSVSAVRAFNLIVNVDRTPLSELMYDVRDGKLTVTIVPSHGEWSPQDVSFRHGDDRYDLVISVGAPDIASLGQLFRDHADFLYRTPILNVDHHASNEQWGQVNLFDVNAVSTTEVLARWIEEWNPDLIDADMATALLAGMIAETRSFRTANVTPRTLQASSRLIEQGARREQIVHALWRTTPVAELNLWGRALSRLEQDPETGLVWTAIATSDELETGASDVSGMVRELLAYAPDAKLLAILHEDRGRIRVELVAKPPASAADVARTFEATGTREYATFTVAGNGPFAAQVQTVTDKLRAALAGR